MAGMFYSLKEAAAKLNKTEQEVKELAKQGKLREFRDGSNLLFKIEEVEALMADMGDTVAQEELPPMEEAEEFAEAAESEMTFEPEEIEAPEFEQAEASEQPVEPEEEMAAEEIGEAEEEAAETEKEEILLAPDSSAPTADADLSSADTALTSKGVNILGETDHDYKLTDDTMAETTISPGTGTGRGG